MQRVPIKKHYSSSTPVHSPGRSSLTSSNLSEYTENSESLMKMMC